PALTNYVVVDSLVHCRNGRRREAGSGDVSSTGSHPSPFGLVIKEAPHSGRHRWGVANLYEGTRRTLLDHLWHSAHIRCTNANATRHRLQRWYAKRLHAAWEKKNVRRGQQVANAAS